MKKNNNNLELKAPPSRELSAFEELPNELLLQIIKILENTSVSNQEIANLRLISRRFYEFIASYLKPGTFLVKSTRMIRWQAEKIEHIKFGVKRCRDNNVVSLFKPYEQQKWRHYIALIAWVMLLFLLICISALRGRFIDSPDNFLKATWQKLADFVEVPTLLMCWLFYSIKYDMKFQRNLQAGSPITEKTMTEVEELLRKYSSFFKLDTLPVNIRNVANLSKKENFSNFFDLLKQSVDKIETLTNQFAEFLLKHRWDFECLSDKQREELNDISNELAEFARDTAPTLWEESSEKRITEIVEEDNNINFIYSRR